MKVLILIPYYKKGDGVSVAVGEFIKNNNFIDTYLILCRWKTNEEKSLNIKTLDSIRDLRFFLKEEKYDIVHYFRGIYSDIFYRVMRAFEGIQQKIPVLTTVCQRPSYKRLLLSPFELKRSSCIVLIDKASYNDPLLEFIPSDRKTQLYLAGDPEISKRTEKISFKRNKDGVIVYGRGTTLSKCPSNMIELFDEIDIPNKLFCIVGIPSGNNWVREKARGRKDIVIYEPLPYDEWFDVCSTFDVCLYQIPVNSHASLDANLGLAMLMRKPVVYYGSEAPKERFIHNENGYVAESYKEFVKYATLLGKNEELRQKIGESARKTTLELLNDIQNNTGFEILYSNLKPTSDLPIPLWYKIKYFFNCYRNVFKQIINYYK